MNKNNLLVRPRLLGYGLLVLLSAWSQEAWVSQVFHRPSPFTLEDLVERSDVQILIVQGPERTEVFRKVILPKETHYNKSQESAYADYEGLYRIIRVIRAHSPVLKAGEDVRVYIRPNYNLHSIQLEHEQGILKSPIISVYRPTHPIAGNEMILFLVNTEIEGKQTWSEKAREGVTAEAGIQKLISQSIP